MVRQPDNSHFDNPAGRADAPLPARRTAIAAAVSIAGALIFGLMCDQLFEFVLKALPWDNDYAAILFTFLIKFGPFPSGVILSTLLVRRMFPASNAKIVYYGLAILLVLEGIVDVAHGGGAAIAIIEVPVIAVAIAATKFLLLPAERRLSNAPASAP